VKYFLDRYPIVTNSKNYFTVIVAKHTVGYYHVTEKDITSSAGAYATHGQAARLERLN
jgi:hypothetical protein